MVKQTQAIRKLEKYLAYVLGRQPDEFGLIPDADGYVKIKELLQALNEENDWRHLRLAHLNELRISDRGRSIEIRDQMIRLQDHSQLPFITVPERLPKLLYTAIRQKAYPAACTKGLKATAERSIVLSSKLEMAHRLGKRKDHDPVILTVQTAPCVSAHVHFQKFGQILFLCDFIPSGVFNGPPLPKEKPHSGRTGSSADQSANRSNANQGPKTPGSYFPDLAARGKVKNRGLERKRRKEIDWKKDRRRARKDKLGQRDT